MSQPPRLLPKNFKSFRRGEQEKTVGGVTALSDEENTDGNPLG